jgi:hypothetical protein
VDGGNLGDLRGLGDDGGITSPLTLIRGAGAPPNIFRTL